MFFGSNLVPPKFSVNKTSSLGQVSFVHGRKRKMQQQSSSKVVRIAGEDDEQITHQIITSDNPSVYGTSIP